MFYSVRNRPTLIQGNVQEQVQSPEMLMCLQHLHIRKVSNQNARVSAPEKMFQDQTIYATGVREQVAISKTNVHLLTRNALFNLNGLLTRNGLRLPTIKIKSLTLLD